jgi:putative transposase
MLHEMSPAPQHLRTYFTTFSTAGRRRVFQVERNAELMVDTLENYRTQGRFSLHAFVIMPDHVHVLLTPADDVSLEKTIQFMKGGFSFRLKSKFEVWERGHFDKRVPDRQAYGACIAYIHRNPVVQDWWTRNAHIPSHRPRDPMRSIPHQSGSLIPQPRAKAPLFFPPVTAG